MVVKIVNNLAIFELGNVRGLEDLTSCAVYNYYNE